MWHGRLGVLAIVLASMLTGLPMFMVGGNDGGNQLEVYSWWTGPGEAEGLAAMSQEFLRQNPGVTFVNGAIAGGAGSNAKAILASRLLANDPPDSYQRHAGLELEDDIRSGKIRDLNFLYDKNGWRDVLPKGLLDHLTVGGKIYAVPVNIHRANLMWYSTKVLADLGIDAPPTTWSDFLVQAEQIRKKGLPAISVGPQWTQKHLMETVLLGELGPDNYEALFNGQLEWTSTQVVAALEIYKKVLGYSDIKSAGSDWGPQLDRVAAGQAVYAVMGDWSSSYLEISKKLHWKKGYGVVATPGSDGVYSFISDAFTLPSGVPKQDLAVKWLEVCGSAEGQDLFNPKKGSIPARTDVDAALYRGYLGWELQQWRDPQIRIVGSLAHGVVANNAFSAEIDSALGLFVQHGNVAQLARAIGAAYKETR